MPAMVMPRTTSSEVIRSAAGIPPRGSAGEAFRSAEGVLLRVSVDAFICSLALQILPTAR
jgi:hypothetical protein